MNHIYPTHVEEDTELYDAVIAGLRDRIGADRPREGVHVSDLLYCLLKTRTLRDLGALRMEALGETPDERIMTYMIGNSHEELFGSRLIRGQAKELDDIWYSVDMWSQPDEDGEMRLIEKKSTRSSAKNELTDSQHYIDQLASYLAAEQLTTGTVAITHLMGDYSKPPQAKLRMHKATFSKHALADWWGELLRRKAVLEDVRIPPAQPRYVWECDYCPVKEYLKCPGGKAA